MCLPSGGAHSQICLSQTAPSDVSPCTVLSPVRDISSNNSLIRHYARSWEHKDEWKQPLLIEVQESGLRWCWWFRTLNTGDGRGKHDCQESVWKGSWVRQKGPGRLSSGETATKWSIERGAGTSCRARILGRYGFMYNPETVVCVFWVKMWQRQEQ